VNGTDSAAKTNRTPLRATKSGKQSE
jgi:hypothetical protein